MRTNETEIKTPGKLLAFFTVFFYDVSNFVFLASIFLHLPFLIDTVNFDASASFFDLFYRTYYFFDIGASLLQLACIIIILCMFGSKRFPTVLSLGASVANYVIATLFSLIIYIIDLKNVYFSLQILYLIPIITIFLSSIFLDDDIFDLLRNKYKPIDSEFENKSRKKKENSDSKRKRGKKKKKGELKPADRQSEEIIIPEGSYFNQQKVISSAAEMAIPDLSNTDDKTNK